MQTSFLKITGTSISGPRRAENNIRIAFLPVFQDFQTQKIPRNKSKYLNISEPSYKFSLSLILKNGWHIIRNFNRAMTIYTCGGSGYHSYTYQSSDDVTNHSHFALMVSYHDVTRAPWWTKSCSQCSQFEKEWKPLFYCIMAPNYTLNYTLRPWFSFRLRLLYTTTYKVYIHFKAPSYCQNDVKGP